MRVSTIIPCHNAGPWIVSALTSAVRQDFPAHEIIVIDDGSTDDSVAQIQKSGIRVNLLRVNVHNAAASRNAGIEAATGDWIAFLDADDVWYPNHLERAAELLNETSDVAFMSNHDWIDLDGFVIEMPDPFRCKLPSSRSGMDVEDYYNIRNAGFHFCHSTVLYRRDHLLAVGMFDVTQMRRHDLDLWLRMIARGSWTYDTLKGAGYRENTPGSLSKDELECDYFELRALVKNIEVINNPLHDARLSRMARRAMGRAFVDAAPEHYTRIRDIAWPHLTGQFRFLYACGSLCPGLLRELIKAKRRVTMKLEGISSASGRQ